MKLSFIMALVGLFGLALINSGSLLVHLGMYLFFIATALALIGYWITDKTNVVAKIESGINRFNSTRDRCKQYYRAVRTGPSAR